MASDEFRRVSIGSDVLLIPLYLLKPIVTHSNPSDCALLYRIVVLCIICRKMVGGVEYRVDSSEKNVKFVR